MTSLTSLTVGGGCAAKYSAARLQKLLEGFVPVEAENLLVGLAPADDAAVYKLDDDRAIVFTLDFFPPLVDDPAVFGRIAATNALNDVFAMGGSPLLALAGKGDASEAIEWMTTLNKDAADAVRAFSPHAVTDVTGFGLFGHAHEMAERSGVRIRLDAGALPVLGDALAVARSGIRTGG